MKVFLVSLIFGDGDGCPSFEAKGIASSKEKCLDIIKKDLEQYVESIYYKGLPHTDYSKADYRPHFSPYDKEVLKALVEELTFDSALIFSKEEEEMYCNYLTCGGYVIEEFDLV